MLPLENKTTKKIIALVMCYTLVNTSMYTQSDETITAKAPDVVAAQSFPPYKPSMQHVLVR